MNPMNGNSRQTARVHLDVCGRHPLLTRGPVVDDDGLSGLTIDMSGLTFASPLDLTAVAALADQAARRDQQVTLIRPVDTGVEAYVERMDLYEQLDPRTTVTASAPAGPRSDQGHVLVEVGRVATTAEASAIGTRFAGVATNQGFGSAVPGLFRALGELLDNAATHGRSEGGAFAAAQFYTGKTSRRQGFELAVCDTGVGVREHLGQRHRRATDQAALELATLAKITGTDDPGRGYGLHDVVQYVGRHAQAAFVLASGGTAVYTSQRGGLLMKTVTAMSTPIEGTWAWLRVRLPIHE
jgi:hypothetical protein